jgi:hypothetical protein
MLLCGAGWHPCEHAYTRARPHQVRSPVGNCRGNNENGSSRRCAGSQGRAQDGRRAGIERHWIERANARCGRAVRAPRVLIARAAFRELYFARSRSPGRSPGSLDAGRLTVFVAPVYTVEQATDHQNVVVVYPRRSTRSIGPRVGSKYTRKGVRGRSAVWGVRA